jgi:hypothetical protein
LAYLLGGKLLALHCLLVSNLHPMGLKGRLVLHSSPLGLPSLRSLGHSLLRSAGRQGLRRCGPYPHRALIHVRHQSHGVKVGLNYILGHGEVLDCLVP